MHLLQNWETWYANSAALRSAVVYLHIGGIVIAGGTALNADWMTLRAAGQGAAERAGQVGRLAGTHRVVVGGLSVVIVSGLLQFASDPGTFLPSRVFWTKMALVVALLLNGVFLLVAEAEAEAGQAGERGWRRLVLASRMSVGLWLAAILAGSVLLND